MIETALFDQDQPFDRSMRKVIVRLHEMHGKGVILKVKDIFNTMDTGSKGCVSNKEFGDVLKMLSKGSISDEECEIVINRCDVDASGGIDYCEFADLCQRHIERDKVMVNKDVGSFAKIERVKNRKSIIDEGNLDLMLSFEKTNEEEDVANYRNDGDQTLYTRKNLKKRQKIKNNRQMQKAMRKVFKTMPTNALGDVAKEDVIAVQVRICKALFYPDDWSYEAAIEAAEEDWLREMGNKQFTTWELFRDSLFETVDVWTEGISVREYVEFLEVLYRRITQETSTTGERGWLDIEHIDSFATPRLGHDDMTFYEIQQNNEPIADKLIADESIAAESIADEKLIEPQHQRNVRTSSLTVDTKPPVQVSGAEQPHTPMTAKERWKNAYCKVSIVNKLSLLHLGHAEKGKNTVLRTVRFSKRKTRLLVKEENLEERFGRIETWEGVSSNPVEEEKKKVQGKNKEQEKRRCKERTKSKKGGRKQQRRKNKVGNISAGATAQKEVERVGGTDVLEGGCDDDGNNDKDGDNDKDVESVEDDDESVEDDDESVEDGDELVEDGDELVEDGDELVEDGDELVEDDDESVEDDDESVEDVEWDSEWDSEDEEKAKKAKEKVKEEEKEKEEEEEGKGKGNTDKWQRPRRISNHAAITIQKQTIVKKGDGNVLDKLGKEAKVSPTVAHLSPLVEAEGKHPDFDLYTKPKERWKEVDLDRGDCSAFESSVREGRGTKQSLQGRPRWKQVAGIAQDKFELSEHDPYEEEWVRPERQLSFPPPPQADRAA